MTSSKLAVGFRGISRLGSAFTFLRWFNLAHKDWTFVSVGLLFINSTKIKTYAESWTLVETFKRNKMHGFKYRTFCE